MCFGGWSGECARLPLFVYLACGVFLVFWESNLAIRHSGNFKFSYSDFPHSWIKGVNLRPVDNPLKAGMTTPAKWDVNSPNPGLELPQLGIRTPTTQDDNSPTRPVENPKIPCIYWAESVFKKSAPIIYS